MPDGDMLSGLPEKLVALGLSFVAGLPRRFGDIGAALESSLAAPQPGPHLADLHRALHSLAGSAGIFGLPELGARSHQLELQVGALVSAPAVDGIALARLAGQTTAYLAWCASHAVQAAPAPTPAPLPRPAQENALGPVYVLEDDVLLSKDIGAQLEYFGYTVTIVNHLEQLAAAIAVQPPAAVVMDMMLGSDPQAGATELARIRREQGLRFPVVFMSTSTCFETRLAAVRAGADAYFPKPLDMLALTERLDVLTARRERAPYRILIVDDDRIVSAYSGAVLEDAGMEVALLHDPAQILSTLSTFQPELVLLDVYMPACSGIELAKLIRQDNKYIDMPIVFLSNEDDFGKQLDAIESGADDFLSKPISPTHLVSSITSRGERYRALRALIMRDSLTLLFNHSAIKEQLSREMARSRRAGGELALAMIDLDFFKRVNDTYGHPVGDQVIRAAARLLQHRLRRSDIVGRYGGEEFAVIFPATSASAAVAVLDEIRRKFGHIRHQGGNGIEFSGSFSAGVVAIGHSVDVEEFFGAADAALYLAKQEGRDRIKQC